VLIARTPHLSNQAHAMFGNSIHRHLLFYFLYTFDMQRIILLCACMMVCFLQINAQNSVVLNIHHKLAEADFALSQGALNNYDDDFNVTRLEYYISDISLIHDGGIETFVEDLWILANASSTTEIDLGQHDVTSVEKLKFYIGVNPDYNHLDPATYPSTHPLAPKFPSMHWGWSPGYRFMVIEGWGGAGYNQRVELHGLGDSNFFMTEVELETTADEGVVNIDINADYTKALEDISVKLGVIAHGDNQQDKRCLENFRDYVFSETIFADTTDMTDTTDMIDTTTASAIIDVTQVLDFNIYPNPVEDKQITVRLDQIDSGFSYDLSITSVEGKQMHFLRSITNGHLINLDNYASGLYFVQLLKEGEVITTNKLFVK